MFPESSEYIPEFGADLARLCHHPHARGLHAPAEERGRTRQEALQGRFPAAGEKSAVFGVRRPEQLPTESEETLSDRHRKQQFPVESQEGRRREVVLVEQLPTEGQEVGRLLRRQGQFPAASEENGRTHGSEELSTESP